MLDNNFLKNSIFLLTQPKTFQLSTIGLDPLRSGYIRILLQYCGVCGSDYSHFLGLRNIQYPFSLGHEFIGQIVEINTSKNQYQIGEYVTSDLNYRCGDCLHCKNKSSHLCDNNRKGLFSNRAFAKYLDIHESYLYSIGSNANSFHALSEPLSCSLHAVKLAEVKDNDTILIVGAGSIGSLIALALSVNLGGTEVHVYDRIPHKMEQLQFCFENVIQVKTKNEKYSVVFDTTGTITGLSLACEKVQKGGHLISMSHLDGKYGKDIIHTRLARKEVSVTFPYLNGERENMIEAINIINNFLPKNFERLVKIFPISNIQTIFNEKTNLEANKIIFTNSDFD